LQKESVSLFIPIIIEWEVKVDSMKKIPREEFRKNPQKYANEFLKRFKNKHRPDLKLIPGGKKKDI
jgi:hypothetical protein